MTNPDALSLWLAAGGVAGSALRALLTTSQPFLSRKSLADLVIGFMVGFLWPLYPLLDFPAGATMLQKAVIVAAIAYLAGDMLLNAFTRVSALLVKLNGTAPAPQIASSTPDAPAPRHVALFEKSRCAPPPDASSAPRVWRDAHYNPPPGDPW